MRDLHSSPTRRSSDLLRLGVIDSEPKLLAGQPSEFAVTRWPPHLVRSHGFRTRCGGQRVTANRSEEHTSELQSHSDLVCRLQLEKKNNKQHLKSRTE